MATENALQRRSLLAGGDLSTKQFHFVKFNGTGSQVVVADSGLSAIGVLQDAPAAAGRAASVGYGGTTKVVAGGTAAAGTRVGVSASGQAVAQASGDLNTVGWFLEDAVADRVVSILFDKRGL